MVKTFGLTHVALAVADPERSFRFYEHLFGMVAVYRKDDFIQVQTPGTRDVLVFERKPAAAGPGRRPRPGALRPGGPHGTARRRAALAGGHPPDPSWLVILSRRRQNGGR